MLKCIDRYRTVLTNQYAVTEQYRPVKVENGSPVEIPGIFLSSFTKR